MKLSLCLTLTLLDQDADCATRMAAKVICYGLLFLAIAWSLLGNLALLSKTGHISRSTIPCPVQLNASAGIAGASFATTHISTLDSLENDDELALLRRQLNESIAALDKQDKRHKEELDRERQRASKELPGTQVRPVWATGGECASLKKQQ